MKNLDYYKEEMLVAAMTGGRCKFIMEHSGGECQERDWADAPVCDICAERFKKWLSLEHAPEGDPSEKDDRLATTEARKRLWDRFNRRI